ncbi:MAG: nuclear transport factor 2 family protein [Gemmatimonadaceae bacterium]
MASDIEPQIVAAEEQLLEAMKTSNVALLDRLLHDALLFNGPAGETATKAMDLANYRTGGICLHTVHASDRQISVIGDDAIVAVTVTLVGNYMGQPIDGRFRYLRAWKSFADGWKVIGGSVVTLSGGG